MGCWQSRIFHKGNRYYELRLCQDLWGQWVILKIYGSIHTKQENQLESLYESHDQALTVFEKLINYRLYQRQYQLLFTQQ